MDPVIADSATASADLKQSRPRRSPAPAASNVVDRLPPHSVEAEQGVLGCVLLAPKEGVGTCVEKFKRGSEVFYDLRHQSIYEILTEMYDQKEAIDLITLQQKLRDRKQLEAIGGIT